MFVYEKKLQYPVRIKNTNPKLASIIISQYGGPNGELGAALRYLSQRYSMPFDEQRGLLTDIGTEELGHLEMVGTIVHQLTRNLTEEQQQESSFAPVFRRSHGWRLSAGGLRRALVCRNDAGHGRPHQRSVREPCGRAEGPLNL